MYFIKYTITNWLLQSLMQMTVRPMLFDQFVRIATDDDSLCMSDAIQFQQNNAERSFAFAKLFTKKKNA